MKIYLARLLWILPIMFLSMRFEDPVLGAVFTVVMTIVTVKLYPLSEPIEED